MKRQELFRMLKVGDRVLVSGETTYSYFWGGIETKNWKRGLRGKIINAVVTKAPATVIQRTDHMVYVELDKSRKPHLTYSCVPECDGIWTIPQKQYMCISIGDACCGDKVIELM